VAIVLVLFPISDEEPALQPGALAALARLGVTSVSLLRDEQTAGLVLEGRGGTRGRRHPRRDPNTRAARPDGGLGRLNRKPNQITGGQVR
jgi:hypothetical protein